MGANCVTAAQRPGFRAGKEYFGKAVVSGRWRTEFLWVFAQGLTPAVVRPLLSPSHCSLLCELFCFL